MAMESGDHSEVAAEEPAMPPVQAYLSKQLGRLAECELMIRGSEDPEGVHQMRVATRRVRAALRTVLASAEADDEVSETIAEFGWLLKTLGRSRDLDVLIEGLETGAAESVDRYGQHLETQRESSRSELLELLDSARYGQLKQRFGEFVAQSELLQDVSVQPVLGRLIPPIRELCSRIDLASGKKCDHLLHKLRIRLKRLRYALEIFAPAYGVPLDEFLAKLRKLQTRIGEFHDLDVAVARLKAYSKDEGTKPDSRLRKLRKRKKRRAVSLRFRICEEDLPRLRRMIKRQKLEQTFGCAPEPCTR